MLIDRKGSSSTAGDRLYELSGGTLKEIDVGSDKTVVINNHGQMAGTGKAAAAWYWDGVNARVPLPVPAGSDARYLDISDDGTVVGVYGTQSPRSFIWRPGDAELEDLLPVSGPCTGAGLAIVAPLSATGLLLVGVQSLADPAGSQNCNSTLAFWRPPQEPQPLALPGNVVIRSFNERGDIAGYVQEGNVVTGVVWHDQVLYRFDERIQSPPPDLRIGAAMAINNNNGAVLAAAVRPSTGGEVYVLLTPPAPKPDLAISVDATAHVQPEGAVTYAVNLQNKGPGTATNVRVEFSMPGGGLIDSTADGAAATPLGRW